MLGWLSNIWKGSQGCMFSCSISNALPRGGSLGRTVTSLNIRVFKYMLSMLFIQCKNSTGKQTLSSTRCLYVVHSSVQAGWKTTASNSLLSPPSLVSESNLWNGILPTIQIWLFLKQIVCGLGYYEENFGSYWQQTIEAAWRILPRSTFETGLRISWDRAMFRV